MSVFHHADDLIVSGSHYGRSPLHAMMFTKRFEAKRRNKDGERWIEHRFPIKGGITLSDIIHIEGRERIRRVEHK